MMITGGGGAAAAVGCATAAARASSALRASGDSADRAIRSFRSESAWAPAPAGLPERSGHASAVQTTDTASKAIPMIVSFVAMNFLNGALP